MPALSTLAACLVFNACLIFNWSALVGKSWASSNNTTWIQVDVETYGAQADQRGPIGGGNGYKNIVTKGDFVVENLEELIPKLNQILETVTTKIAIRIISKFDNIGIIRQPISDLLILRADINTKIYEDLSKEYRRRFF